MKIIRKIQASIKNIFRCIIKVYQNSSKWTINQHIILAAISTILIIGMNYTIAVTLHQPEKIWDWLNTLVGTGLSFTLAILGGIYLFRYQNISTEKSENEKLKDLLTAEFSDLSRILNSEDKMKYTLKNGNSIYILIAYTQPLIIEKSVASGLFDSIINENLLHLARKIRMHQFQTEKLTSLILSKALDDYIIYIANNLETCRKGCVDGIKQVAEQIGVKVNDNYPD
ncbi:hypothetical protein [Aeromonas veronii]|uniref:hypothetical protein n=1 Tax=Aeromonas veronii TaxID=654 RepID=UPI0010102307|nr:hypothetical protein [Aeromonas veronii]